MQHIAPSHPLQPLPLWGAQSTRTFEQRALQQLPPLTLMQRAGEAIFRLGSALYPHARNVWVVCGPGNNGGDGLLAACHWHRWFQQLGDGQITVTWHANPSRLPDDARQAWQQALAQGVRFSPTPPQHFDLAVDALLGLGVHTATTGPLAHWAQTLHLSQAPVLCVDLPSGLNPDTGDWLNPCPSTPHSPRHTLALLTLKPGLFTAHGREACGDIWLDTLGVTADTPPDALLYAPPCPAPRPRHTRHNAHKGSHGDVQVIGGQDITCNGQGMTGAAILAARAALRSGTGKVFVTLLGTPPQTHPKFDPVWPELMFRSLDDALTPQRLHDAVTVCGCGGGTTVAEALPHLLQHSRRLVLDADALNALATRPDWQTLLQNRHAQQQFTVLTPHPLEAARLLNTDTAHVQHNRLHAAQTLADQLRCSVVLKGSGTITATPGEPPWINGSGNALLATAGTGDVLAGMIGAQWALHPDSPAWAAAQAVWQHGALASTTDHTEQGFSASTLIGRLTPL